MRTLHATRAIYPSTLNDLLRLFLRDPLSHSLSQRDPYPPPLRDPLTPMYKCMAQYKSCASVLLIGEILDLVTS